VQSWSCEGRTGSNVAQYCNPRVDSLLAAAQIRRVNALQTYREAVRTIVADVPAVFLFAPVNPVAIHRRIANVALRPDSPWASLWRWTIRSAP
jgi:ABC-type transport system substrate-binding protein